MNYSITQRILDLKAKVTASREFWLREARNQMASISSARESGASAAKKYDAEIAPWLAEIDVLTAPIVGFAEHDGKLFLATERGAFELRDGAFFMAPLLAPHNDAPAVTLTGVAAE